MRTLLATLLLLGTATGFARIGLDAAPTIAALDEAGLDASGSFSYEAVTYDGLLFSLNGQLEAGPADFANLGQVVGIGTGFGEGIAPAVAGFMEANLDAMLETGVAIVPVEGGYLLQFELNEGDDGVVSIDWEFGLRELDEAAFPEVSNALGADLEDARIVIREFSDLQCPHCQNFALNVLPQIEELIAGDDGIRFEFHHLPLVTIHANAMPAAEAAECVAAANADGAFWDYSHAVFERMQAWQALPDTQQYFVSLAQELGLATDGVAECIADRVQLEPIREAADYAIRQLGVTGTPGVFVNGFQVGAWNQLDSYLELMALIEARNNNP